MTILLLAVVLVVGSEVNGSTRWIRLAFGLASEVAKVMMAIFTADYVVRRAEEVRNNLSGLFRLGVRFRRFNPAEPDWGQLLLPMRGCSSAGAPAIQFIAFLAFIILGLAAAIILEPYRFNDFPFYRSLGYPRYRVTSFPTH